MLEGLIRDFQFAMRGLRRSAGFAAVAVLTLAIGIGATTAVFSAVYHVVIKPLPFPNADRLVRIVQILESAGDTEQVRAGLSPNQFAALQQHSATLAAVGPFHPAARTLTGQGVPVRLSGAAVAPQLFAGLGVAPAVGRTFVAEDALRAETVDPAVILSHQTWARYFNSDRTIVGRRIALGDARAEVIGVMPQGFGFPSLASDSMARNSAGELENAPEFWFAVPPYQRGDENGGFSLFIAFGLLEDGATPAQAAAEVAALDMPDQMRRRRVEVVPAHTESAHAVGGVLATFQLGAVLILLIACVNVVNLLLARTAHRRGDAAIRLALGASGARVARERLCESVMLALAGGTLGIAIAYAVVAVLRSMPPHLLPRIQELRVDETVLLFTLMLSVLTGVGVGLVSALRAGRQRDLHGAASLWTNRATLSPKGRPSQLLVVFEIAAAMVLLVGAGLLINSYAHLMRVQPGLDPDRTITMQLTLGTQRYATPGAQRQMVEDVLEGVRALPDVVGAAATSLTLTGAPIGMSDVSVDGRVVAGHIQYRTITSDYFRALGVRLQRGREFVDAERAPAVNAAIVNDTFVRRYLAGRNPVGATLRFGDRDAMQVVGVAADWKLRLDDEVEPELYLPSDDRASFPLATFVVRTVGDPRLVVPGVREIVRQLDAGQAVHNIATIDEMLGHTASSPRFLSFVSLWSMTLALLLAATGIYGLIAYSMGTRTRELGIRIALGATAGALTMSVIRQGLAMSAGGIAIGAAGAYYLTQFLDTLLFGLTPTDPTTFLTAGAMFLVVALVASYLPSRQATRVDPIAALRAE